MYNSHGSFGFAGGFSRASTLRFVAAGGRAGHGPAQFQDLPVDKGVTLGAETTARIRVGLIVRAGGGAIFRVVSTAPVPADWPEQSVRIVKEDVSPSVSDLRYRTLTGGGSVKQMIIEIPQLAAGQEAKALVTFEVTRRTITGPKDTALFEIPKKLDRQLQIDVGPSPYIESRHPKIVAAAKAAVGDQEEAWKKVEAIYDWVRENVAYETCELKGAAGPGGQERRRRRVDLAVRRHVPDAEDSGPHGVRPGPLLRRVLPG